MRIKARWIDKRHLTLEKDPTGILSYLDYSSSFPGQLVGSQIADVGEPLLSTGDYGQVQIQSMGFQDQNFQLASQGQYATNQVVALLDQVHLEKTVLIVWRDLDPTSDALHKKWTQKLAEHRRLQQATSWEQLSCHMSRLVSKPSEPVSSTHAVVVMDAGLFLENHDKRPQILRDLRIYVYRGGTLILTPEFAKNPAAEVNGLLEEFGRKWKIGPVKQMEICEDSHLKAMLVRLRRRRCSMYNGYMLPESANLPKETDAPPPADCTRMTSPIIWQKSMGGWFGFVRDLKVREDSWRVVSAMCGLEIQL